MRPFHRILFTGVSFLILPYLTGICVPQAFGQAPTQGQAVPTQAQISAQISVQRSKDSLRKVIADMNVDGAERLKTYGRLSNLYRFENVENPDEDSVFIIYDEMDA